MTQCCEQCGANSHVYSIWLGSVTVINGFWGMVGCPEVIWISLCAAGKRIKKYENNLCILAILTRNGVEKEVFIGIFMSCG